MDQQTFHEAITLYRLCKEFGWTPDVVKRQDARDIEHLITILQEMDRLQQVTAHKDPGETIILVE